MKNKSFAILATLAFSHGMANAVTLATNIFANATTAGLVTTTLDGTPAAPRSTVSGSAYLYSSSVQITALQVTTVTSRAQFEELLITNGGTALRTTTITNGAITPLSGTDANLDVGAAGNNVYVWMQNTAGTTYGLFQSADVPNLGSLNITPTSATGDWIGTSVLSAAGTDPVTPISGWQLYSIPEPSAALLGALGALGLLRRRRI